MKPNLLVVDLSHWDPAEDYEAVTAAGVVGVIYKATQGSGYHDPTYHKQRSAALKADLLWGAYHFGDASNPKKQVDNFLGFAEINANTLFCLDFEDYSSQMSLDGARAFIQECEDRLGRPAECVIYSGNTIKEFLGDTNDEFFGARRLWLAQYGNKAVCQCSWDNYWLWQYTDGTYGPQPHSVDGCDSAGVDCNHYDGTAEQLAAEWAGGSAVPPEPVPPDYIATVTVVAPPNIRIQIVQSESAPS